MKKVKIMLMSIAVLAVVGGALAFKVKKFSFVSYCTTVENGTNLCPNETTSTTTPGTGTAVYKWAPTNGTDEPCTPAPECIGVNSFIKEN